MEICTTYQNSNKISRILSPFEYVLFIIKGDVREKLATFSVNRIRESRMIRVQFMPIRQNLIGELIQVFDWSGKPRNGICMILIIMTNNLVVARHFFQAIQSRLNIVDPSFGPFIVHFNHKLVGIFGPLGGPRFDMSQVDTMCLKWRKIRLRTPSELSYSFTLNTFNASAKAPTPSLSEKMTEVFFPPLPFRLKLPPPIFEGYTDEEIKSVLMMLAMLFF